MIYPWQQHLWDEVMRCWQQQRWPHASLFYGAMGLGKHAFIQQLAQTLLCESNQSQPCHHCQACHLFEAKTHPDFNWIQPEENSKTIKIEVIRQLMTTALLTPRYGRYQIIVLAPAEALTHAAANALLKALEEPVSQTVFFLLSQQPQQLPVTVRSRCQSWSFDRCDDAKKKNWLKKELNLDNNKIETLLDLYAGPLLAKAHWTTQQTHYQQVFNQWLATLQGQQDVVTTATTWSALDLSQLFSWLYHWVTALIRHQAYPINNAAIQPLIDWARPISPQDLFKLLDCIVQARQHFTLNQLKPQSCLEAILLTGLSLKK